MPLFSLRVGHFLIAVTVFHVELSELHLSTRMHETASSQKRYDTSLQREVLRALMSAQWAKKEGISSAERVLMFEGVAKIGIGSSSGGDLLVVLSDGSCTQVV